MKKSATLKNPRKKMTYNEHKHQAAFFEWLEWRYPELFELCFSIPNEARRSYALAHAMKKRGLKSGIPDVFCAVPYGGKHGLFIEFKSSGNKVGFTQSLRMDFFILAGYHCIVCHSVDEAIEGFKKYIGIANVLQKE